MNIVGRALLWALAGLVAGPVVVLALGSVAVWLDPTCAGGGSNGGCAMAVFGATIAAGPLGAILLFVAGIVRGLIRRRRLPPV